MARATSEQVSPVGTSVADHITRSLKDPEFRAEYERLAPFEALARIVIMRRDVLGLTQAGLASRMGTTASVISRIESGQHATSARTLKRLAEALDGHALFGFDFGTESEPARELVAL
ncbi:MAG TPA: helix-turn-helix transcriptional regulator [Solirubrobacteraceae bacterium]|jgi:ribosome-binding protein aMBF1 (putative translation factor)